MFLLTILSELKNCSKFFEICNKFANSYPNSANEAQIQAKWPKSWPENSGLVSFILATEIQILALETQILVSENQILPY